MKLLMENWKKYLKESDDDDDYDYDAYRKERGIDFEKTELKLKNAVEELEKRLVWRPAVWGKLDKLLEEVLADFRRAQPGVTSGELHEAKDEWQPPTLDGYDAEELQRLIKMYMMELFEWHAGGWTPTADDGYRDVPDEIAVEAIAKVTATLEKIIPRPTAPRHGDGTDPATVHERINKQ